MSNKMITAAWDVPLPAHSRLVLIALADSASDDEGVCWISNKTIMEKSTCAKTTLGYILFAFEKLGIILRETRFRPENGSQTSSLKRVVIPVFSGSKKEIEEAKMKFKAEYETAYISARLKKDTPSHHVTGGEGSQGDLPHTTQGDLPPVTQCDRLYEPSVEPTFLKEDKTPLTPNLGTEVGCKFSKNKKTPTLADLADQHRMTISAIEDFLKFRENSGGIKTPPAFKKYVLRELSEPYSDESLYLEEWFESLTRMDIIDHLIDQFLSTQRFDRRFCRELANDDFTLKANNIVPSDVLIEISYQKAEAKRRERIGGVA